jgi:anti-anti-sigma factor
VAEAALTIELRPGDGAVEVVVAGEVDLSTAPQLQSALEALDQGWRRVVLDLADVTFMDSSGIAVIVRANGRFGPELRQLVIRHPRENVLQLLRLTGVSELCEGDPSS